MINLVLFDMDGTLIDSSKMVISRYVETFEYFGIQIPDAKELHALVGPSAAMTMTKYLGSAKVDQGVAYYRKLAKRDGMLGLQTFPGITQMLHAVFDAGFKLAVATSKPENEAVKILHNLELSSYFQVVSGASDLLGINTKSDVISAALSRLGNPVIEEVVMVGDRIFDIEAASNLGISSIFVEWGGADLGEADGASKIVSSPEQILPVIRSL